MIFANPWGFLFLLAIPPIIIMHMLQRRHRQLPCSTLFLLPKTTPKSKAGQRFDKLRHSLLLYLQIFAVLIITWLLIEPHWQRQQAVLKVAVVIDSSLSMRAFEKDIAPTLEKNLRPLIQQAKHTELHLISSRAEDAVIYSGASLDEALSFLKQWRPNHTAHDILPSLEIGENLINSQGVTILISDHKHKIPTRFQQVLIGEKVANIGFAGLKSQGNKWAVFVRNYSDLTQKVEIRNGQTIIQTINLAADKIHEVSGTFKPNQDSLTLTLNDDAFSLDNRITIVRELPKEISLKVAESSPEENQFWLRFSASIENHKLDKNQPDLHIKAIDKIADIPNASGIFYYAKQSGKLRLSPVLPSNEELNRGLQWQGLTSLSGTLLPLKSNIYQTLLWHDNEAFIITLKDRNKQQLIFRYNPFAGNTFEKSSSLILMQRFIENLRADKKAYFRKNYELNQKVDIEGPIQFKNSTGGFQELTNKRAPATIDFFSLWQDGEKIVDGATHFADIQEANFSDAISFSNIEAYRRALVQKNARDDFFREWFYLLLIATLGAIWYLSDKKRPSSNN